MTDSEKRQYVANLYHGPKWKKRVAKMDDDQVTAIYLQHLTKGIKPKHKEGQKHLPRVPQDPHRNEDAFPIY